MSETVFTKVDYNLSGLINSISLGEIGLPDIQRPFVWKNTKVRDLFDSMYKGYPVGYFLFWQTASADTGRTIGVEQKQKPPRLVIVDGQQRLTSLYAVVKQLPVLRETFQRETIQIAFNPLDERFEVADAAIKRDKSFLPDISVLWAPKARLIRIIGDHIANVQSNRTLTDSEERKIEENISKLQGLLSFPFTALELGSDIDDEAVSDVFVRINSAGTPLNQADFILTLMSVFWDEGRSDLEEFCRKARVPSRGEPSPFNYFIEPEPAQLLRVGVGVAFKRAVLKYVYSILRGKDLETGQFSGERREEQFNRLKDAQERVLNLQYWHDFLKCIRQAGFRSGKMISSQNNLIFSYVLYLIGRTEYGIPEHDLRNAIARWFFMSAVTGRFTGSPESAMEFDLANLRDVDSGKGFLQKIDHICSVTLTTDFWGVTLPNDLATSAHRSPSLFAYQAAQVLLDSPALFSRLKVAELMDPSVNTHRNAVEKHHLFPKSYLNRKGISATRETNQIANFALVEWNDNSGISDKAPADYLPALKERFESSELARMFRLHALPSNWELLEYEEFLKKRRELMAQIIREGYMKLASGRPEVAVPEALDLYQTLVKGESEAVEFKSTLRTNLHTRSVDPRMENSVLKTIAGFLNTNGGTLIIGVADDGTPLGVGVDGFENEDKMALHLVNITKTRLGTEALTNIGLHFDDHDGFRVLIVRAKIGTRPVYLKDGNVEKFYVRTGPSTTELAPSQMHDYLRQRF